MAVSIEDHELPYLTHNTYTITFHTTTLHTLVTHTPSFVENWISTHTATTPQLIGLDVEWRPNFSRQSDNPIATLQLSTSQNCLVFQILHSPSIPQSLTNLLSNRDYTFVGVGIDEDTEKLLFDYGLGVANPVDLRVWAKEKGFGDLKNAGLKEMSRVLLGKEVVKPKRVTMSRWDSEWLYPEQVQYAALDAFLSFEIGRVLSAAAGN
ncbi:hypothetical protein LguiB_004100 [Lonicera macranthoides]